MPEKPIAQPGPNWVPLKLRVHPAIVEHLKKRIAERHISPQDVQAMLAWVNTRPLVPKTFWYRRFPNFILVGERDEPKSILTRNMKPWGIRVGHRLLASKTEGAASNPVLADVQTTETTPKFKYGTVQAELPADSDAYAAVADVREEIAEEDLAGKGVNIGPTHITVRYGIQTDDTSTIEAYLSKRGPMKATLGATDMFPPSESSDHATVIIAPVECPELFEINERLADAGDFKAPDFDYKPHVTVAYVKPDVAEAYVGLDATAGQSFLIREVTVVARDKSKKVVTLNGAIEKQARPTQEQSSVGQAGAITDTPAFKAWFAGSKVVDAQGKPQAMFHHTTKDFDAFDPLLGEGGNHFGTKSQINSFEVRDGSRVIPVYLSIKNPLRLQDFGDFSASYVVSQLEDMGLLKGHDGYDYEVDEDSSEITRIIQSHGYDGIVYLNRREGDVEETGYPQYDEVSDSDEVARKALPNAEDSYIAFHPSQVKSAIGNKGTFDPKSPSITAAAQAPQTKPMGADWKASLEEKWGPGIEARPDLKSLFERLVSLGGEYALLKADENPPEEVERLLTRGEYRSGRAKLKRMKALSCHWNAAELMHEGKGTVITGYALSEDGLWRQHSWLQTPQNTLIETTVKRLAYYGVPLTWEEVKREFHIQWKLPPKSITAAAPQIDYRPLLTELMTVLKPGLPVPEVKVVNSKTNWLGICRWSYGMEAGATRADTNSRIELQRRALVDEQTAKRIIAHELAHHEDNLVNVRPEVLRMGFRSYKIVHGRRDGHGPSWKAIAARFNAKYGEDFVTPTSDEDMVLDSSPVKPYYVFVYDRGKGPMVQHATRLSEKMVTTLAKFVATGHGDFRLFLTTDPWFRDTPLIDSGRSYIGKGAPKAEELWASGENVLAKTITEQQALFGQAKQQPYFVLMSRWGYYRNKLAWQHATNLTPKMLEYLKSMGADTESKLFRIDDPFFRDSPKIAPKGRLHFSSNDEEQAKAEKLFAEGENIIRQFAAKNEKQAAITPAERTVYHGSNVEEEFDTPQPNLHGIIWLAEEHAARDYSYTHFRKGRRRMYEVKLKASAKIVDLLDTSNPFVQACMESFRAIKRNVWALNAKLTPELWARYADFGFLESYPWAIESAKEFGVDGIIVRDTSEAYKRHRDPKHDSIALVNPDAIESVREVEGDLPPDGTEGGEAKTASSRYGFKKETDHKDHTWLFVYDLENGSIPNETDWENGNYIGYIELNPVAEKDRLVVSDVWVTDSYRGRGVGKLLYTKAREEAQALGYALVSDWRHTSPEAERVWDSLGAEKVEEEGKRRRVLASEGLVKQKQTATGLTPVGVDSLPNPTQQDIAYILSEKLARLGYDEEGFRVNLFGLVDEAHVLTGKLPTEQVYATMRRSPSEMAVQKYVQMLQDPNFEFDPILVAKGKFLDGGHRTEAYHRAGRQLIPVVDITNLINAKSWRMIMEDETDKSTAELFPLKPAPEAASKQAANVTQDQSWMGRPGDITETKAFKRWFAGSKITDDHGRPLMMYHGTKEPFSRVDMSQGAMGVFWLTSNLPGLLRGEAGAVSTKTVLRCFVKITNPAGWDEYEKKSLGELKRDGYDGVILPDPDGSFDTIVFKPNQVKILPHEPQAKDAKVADVVQLPNPENPATDTPAFKSWFSGSKVVDAHGKPQRVYRGDFRADRIGDTFKVNRTTSGRFYFTDDPEIASRYSEKVDHRHVEENSEYASWFRFPQFKGRGVRKAPDMKQAWYYLTPEQRERVKHVALTTSTDEDGEIVFEADSPVNGNIEWEARQMHGNWLMALADTWLNSGVLYDDEPKFGKILERCGLNFAFDDPQQARSVVTPVYLRIRNPLDTSHIPQNVLDRLHQLAKSDRSRAKPVGYDQWDKTTKTVRDWVSMLDDDLRNHTTMAWTVIPEKVTQTLQSLGFDGIKDVGGKMGGNSHTVWIAFEPNQIKSALGNNGNYSLDKDSIVASQRNRLAEPEAS